MPILASLAPWAIGLLVVGFMLISILMILVVLVQKPQGGGLSGAFGASSDGAGQTAFGAKTGDFLTQFTILVFLLFLGASIGLNYAVRPPADQTATLNPGDDIEQSTSETGTEGGGAEGGSDGGAEGGAGESAGGAAPSVGDVEEAAAEPEAGDPGSAGAGGADASESDPAVPGR